MAWRWLLTGWVLSLTVWAVPATAAGLHCGNPMGHALCDRETLQDSNVFFELVNRYANRKIRKAKRSANRNRFANASGGAVVISSRNTRPDGMWVRFFKQHFGGLRAKVRGERLVSTSIKFVFPID